MVFIRSERFLIQVRDRLNQEDSYRSPPRVSWIEELPRSMDGPRGDSGLAHFTDLCQKPYLFHVLEFFLTLNDVVSGSLVSFFCLA